MLVIFDSCWEKVIWDGVKVECIWGVLEVEKFNGDIFMVGDDIVGRLEWFMVLMLNGCVGCKDGNIL